MINLHQLCCLFHYVLWFTRTLASCARCLFCTKAERYMAKPPSGFDGNIKYRWTLERSRKEMSQRSFLWDKTIAQMRGLFCTELMWFPKFTHVKSKPDFHMFRRVLPGQRSELNTFSGSFSFFPANLPACPDLTYSTQFSWFASPHLTTVSFSTEILQG